jgi:hypothetical protein
MNAFGGRSSLVVVFHAENNKNVEFYRTLYEAVWVE